ncbi:helix-turn-helix protein [Paraburkholderia sp. BL27I4N3]|nr:helix-turn-helix domain-containing protein [Paraburkholderia sp. BL27I4N3]REE18171.1 helix-turn-helix protein [Paraburkholderia sp. BL27I4N3]
MGTTPYDFLLHLRLGRCCRLLVGIRPPVDKIARRCGMGSGGRLATLFRKHLGKTPTDYRAIQRRLGESSQGNRNVRSWNQNCIV